MDLRDYYYYYFIVLLGFALSFSELLGSVFVISVFIYWVISNQFIKSLNLFIFTIILSDLGRYPITSQLKSVLLLLLIAVFFLKRKDFIQHRNLLFPVFSVFIFSVIISWFYSPTPFISFQKTLSYILMFGFLPPLVFGLISTSGKEFILHITGFVFFLLLLTFITSVLGFSFFGPNFLYGRFTGFMGNPNGLGLILFMSLALYLIGDRVGLISDFRKEYKKFDFFFIFSHAFAIFISGSRTSFGALILVIFFLLIFKKSSYLYLIFLVVLVVTFQTNLSIFVNVAASLGLQDFLRVETLESGSGRSFAREFGWLLIQDNFYFGKGFAYSEYLVGFYDKFLQANNNSGNFHNSFITLWLDTGLFGLFILISSFLIAGLKVKKFRREFFIIVLIFFFTAFFESWLAASLNPYTPLFLSILAVILAVDEEQLVAETLS